MVSVIVRWLTAIFISDDARKFPLDIGINIVQFLLFPRSYLKLEMKKFGEQKVKSHQEKILFWI